MFKKNIHNKEEIEKIINYLFNKKVSIKYPSLKSINYDSCFSKITTEPSYSGKVILNFCGYNFEFVLTDNLLPEELLVYINDDEIYFPKEWDNYISINNKNNEYIGNILFLKNDIILIEVLFSNLEFNKNESVSVDIYINEEFSIKDVSSNIFDFDENKSYLSLNIDKINLTKIKALLNKYYNDDVNFEKIRSDSIIFSSFSWDL